MRDLRAFVCVCLAVVVAGLPVVAAATGEAKPGAKSPTTTAAVSKQQKCAEMKKRLADYQAQSNPKNAKNPETIKQDMDWYKKNCQ